jgi:protein SCO1/2
VKLALNEASSGKIGTIVDQIVLFCFQYNPHQSKYTLYAFNIMKLSGALMVLVLALWLLPIWVRARKANAKVARS